MKASLKRWGSVALALLLGGAGLFGAAGSLNGAVNRQSLKSSNLTGLRAEALVMFPRGSRLDDAASHLAAIGFLCDPIAPPLPDISSPTLRCASNGRGYPDYPAVNVILLARNGLVSDVDVWNIMARADGEADDIDFTAIGASNALPARLRRPTAPETVGSIDTDPKS